MKKYFILFLFVCIISSCGVRLPEDYEYNLDQIANTNEELLKRIQEEVPPEERESEYIEIIKQDINDFRNAAETVRVGR